MIKNNSWKVIGGGVLIAFGILLCIHAEGDIEVLKALFGGGLFIGVGLLPLSNKGSVSKGEKK